jgi:replicative DNA helicase
MLYRPQIDDENREQDEATPVCLDIAKQRNGPSGEVKLTFLKPYTRFESAAKVSDEDVPNDQQHDLDYHER